MFMVRRLYAESCIGIWKALGGTILRYSLFQLVKKCLHEFFPDECNDCELDGNSSLEYL